MVPKIASTLKSLAVGWLIETGSECVVAFRGYLALGSLAVFAVLLFKPEATADQAATFALVPLAVLMCGSRILMNLGSYLPGTPAQMGRGVATTPFVSGIAFCIPLALVAFPSMFIFRWLGMNWAADFMSSCTELLAAAAVAGRILAGAQVTQAFRLLPSLFASVESTERKRFVGC